MSRKPQVIGSFLDAVVVWLACYPNKLMVFSTYPIMLHKGRNFATELIATTLLIVFVVAFISYGNNLLFALCLWVCDFGNRSMPILAPVRSGLNLFLYAQKISWSMLHLANFRQHLPLELRIILSGNCVL